MDAGARGRRLLQRREYKAKVSEFIPKELEDQFSHDENGQLVYELDLKKVGEKLKKGLKNFINRPIMKDYPTQQQYQQSIQNKTSNQYQSYEPEGEMIEANSAQMKAMHDAKLKKMEDDKVAKKTKKEEVELEAKKSCGEGEYYCYDEQKCKPIPDGMKVGKDGMLVKEDMKGMSQKSGDKRSTESGAGMTAKGVAKYNRRTGGNLKTAVTTPPSKLKAGSKAAKRRKSFCARSKSWTGPRGKAARRRWNCSYEPELPMIIDEKKKLFNTSPLSDRVSNWSRKISEGDTYVKSNRNPLTGLPNLGKGDKKKSSETKTSGVNYGAMAQSYEPQGEVIQDGYGDVPFRDGRVKNYLGKDNIKNIRLTQKGKQAFRTIPDPIIKSGNKIINPPNPVTNMYKSLDRVNSSYEPQGDMVERKMTSSEKDKKEKYVKGMKKVKGDFTKRYGKDGKSVMYATATKMAMKKEEAFDEAKYEKGASTYGKASIRNKRAFGKGGNAASPEERGAAIKTRRAKHQERRFVKKGNKYHEPGKHRPDVAGVNKPEDETKYKKNQYAKENALIDKIKNDFNIIKKTKNVVDKYNQKLQQNNDAINKVIPGSASLNNEGSLHKWFKGSKSKDGKGGWVNVVTGGTCASDKPGEGTPKCVSSSKRASMTKAERLSASRRKKKADPGQQSKSGAAKPTYVATDSKRKKK